MHLDNNIAWLDALREQSKNFQNVRGLVITGWQRYDHLGNLCELLPVNFFFNLIIRTFLKIVLFAVWLAVFDFGSTYCFKWKI